MKAFQGTSVEHIKKVILQIALATGVLSALAACAPSIFQKELDCGRGCTRSATEFTKQIEYTMKVPGLKVDVLFVDDNSGSMSFEQNRMATRFQTLLDQLEAQHLDYRIAITTTDVSSAANPPRPINNNGGLQDGRLIPFPTGVSYIESSTPNKLQLFQQAIQRAETLTCENYIRQTGGQSTDRVAYQTYCPADDERGVMAANMFVDANYGGFLREGSHFAVVFLADEDVHSGLYSQAAGFPLEARDLPFSLMQNIQSKFPGKSFSFHSIIVRPGPLASDVSAAAASNFLNEASAFGNYQWPAEVQPGQLFNEANKDYSCLSQQGQQTPGVNGSFGYIYALAAQLTNGITGDICASDYGSQLRTIGANIGKQVNQINLACANPKIIELKYTNKSGIPLGTFAGTTFTLDPSVAVGDSIYLKIECPDL